MPSGHAAGRRHRRRRGPCSRSRGRRLRGRSELALLHVVFLSDIDRRSPFPSTVPAFRSAIPGSRYGSRQCVGRAMPMLLARRDQTTSPGRIRHVPPSHSAHPAPAVMIRVCPRGWVCQAVRAPVRSHAPRRKTRDGSGALLSGSMRTLPVKGSRWPRCEGCDPARFRIMAILLRYRSDLGGGSIKRLDAKNAHAPMSRI